jgi:transposase
MRFYTKPHKFYGGLDVHARTMYLCVLTQAGEILLHRNLNAGPEPFLKAMAPYREDVVVCVACLVTWYWLAALCTREGMPFVRGHALYMKAIHGGQAKHEKIDAQKIAVLQRGGMRPQAYVYPTERRATRDLLRRRLPLTRKRAERLAPSQHTHSPYNLPEIGKKLADKANRAGVAARVPDPAVQKSLEVDLALMGHDDDRLTDLERDLVQTAHAHAAQTFSRVRSIPGVGQIRALVRLDDSHDIRRFPRVQACVSSGRLVKCAQESAGKRDGTSGQKIGHASLTGACSEAAVRLLRNNPAGHKSLARFEKKHRQGKALTVLAHQLARAIYDLLTRDTACDLDKFFHECWSGAGEPAASRAADGISRARECWER